VGGDVILKGVAIGPFNYTQQSGYPTTLIEQLWGTGLGAVLVDLQLFLVA